MAIEVEQKYPLADVAELERQLTALRAGRGETQTQVDSYFAHPARDFAQTDEALRLRRVGNVNYITYKGPKLDRTTKTRQEVEIELPAGHRSADDAKALLVALGFRPVVDVRKRRTPWNVRWQEWEIGVAVDDVAEVGSFVELEIVVEPAETSAARTAISALAERLNLSNAERRSYLELLLAARGQTGSTS